MLLPVVMAGGSGTRLWPLSRTLFPKQFLSLTSDATMLQDTLQRIEPLAHQPAFIICNQEHRFIVAEQLRKAKLSHGGIVLEPVGRNTAPAVAVAALHAIAKGEDPLLLVLAADHVIAQPDVFCSVVQAAMPLAEQGKLVTFGIVPTAAETGYGYIQQGMDIGQGASMVEAFVEKPDFELAQKYLVICGIAACFCSRLRFIYKSWYSIVRKWCWHVSSHCDYLKMISILSDLIQKPLLCARMIRSIMR